LNAHDVLILIEEGGRGSLFDKVVDLAEEQPDHQYLGAYRRAWRDAMRLLASRYNKGSATDYQTMLAVLRAAGSNISTELSVRNWVLGRVIGPDDLSSIQAVGYVTQIDSLVRDCRDFDRAFRTIRSIHQGLGRRLTRAIRESSRQFVGGATKEEIEALGQYIWLPLAELLETVDLAEVIEIKRQPQRIAPNRVGRFVPLPK
jgi:hypothetical protein